MEAGASGRGGARRADPRKTGKAAEPAVNDSISESSAVASVPSPHPAKAEKAALPSSCVREDLLPPKPNYRRRPHRQPHFPALSAPVSGYEFRQTTELQVPTAPAPAPLRFSQGPTGVGVQEPGRNRKRQGAPGRQREEAELQMAQPCFQNEYFDSLLHACKPCHLRCSNTPPVTCQRYCDTSTRSSVKGTSAVHWTCLGLSVVVSLVVFTVLFLLRKVSSQSLKDGFQSTGSALLDMSNADQDPSKTEDEMILPRGYTVEECTCEDCVKNKGNVDSDHFFPLPAMEEGATILVTTKTNDYCKSVPAAPESVTTGTDGTEKSISPN
uniref:tumor necrosis factor receptor superfamily member 17 n=1 Tax=Jaculus jaculus TaxID=51337 RepID=UPI001E1B5535|nr:tumor necrosis factor receptor superfamily member 17 [Jaculus jaculus]